MATARDGRGKRRKAGARTAGGKRSNPQQMARAEQESRDFLRERTEEGHLAAGRIPPSQSQATRQAGATEVAVDQSIRTFVPLTEDEKLLRPALQPDDFTRTDPWRVLRIMGEIIEGFDTLAGLEKGVTFFGSARTPT